jgi:hypothetical protein
MCTTDIPTADVGNVPLPRFNLLPTIPDTTDDSILTSAYTALVGTVGVLAPAD